MSWFKKTKEASLENKSVIHAQTELLCRHLDKGGNEIQRRIIKNKVVTTGFVGDIVAVLKGTTADRDKFITYKWHDSGISTAVEAIANTVLGTPQTAGTRESGTQTSGTAANVYKSVATTTYSSTKSITEHGLFNVSATGVAGAHLMDRTVFAAINVSNTDKIEFTFQITFSSGG